MLGHQSGSEEDIDKLRVKLHQYSMRCLGLKTCLNIFCFSSHAGLSRALYAKEKPHPVATAIRDYQYLQDRRPLSKDLARTRKIGLHKYFYSAVSFFGPWESHYSYFQDQQHRHSSTDADPLRQLFMHHLPSRLTFSHHERLARAEEYEDGLQPKEVSSFVDRLARFVVAIAGGIFLVIPMVIMVLEPSETKSVVTVSMAVLTFSLILSFGIKVSNVETLVSTATYAAVLVVFVGTSSGGNNS